MHSLLNHPLVVDFPEHKETIQALKLNNAHFKHLLEQYQTVDEEIVRIETELEPASDARTEQLKRRRLQLKDELMALVGLIRPEGPSGGYGLSGTAWVPGQIILQPAA